ncbi:MAG: S8 family peptidase [Candidatus Woesearchaeota archaeon]
MESGHFFASVGFTTVLILLATFIVVPNYPITGMSVYEPDSLTLREGDYRKAIDILKEHDLKREIEQVVSQLEQRDELDSRDLKVIRKIVEDIDDDVREDIEKALGYDKKRRSYIVEFGKQQVGVMSARSVHAQFKKDLKDMRGVSIASVDRGREFKRVFNGMQVMLSDEEYSKVTSLSYIKNVHMDREVHALVEKSAGSIGAGTGQLDHNGSGITIAVIDTGVDYTHPDFGNCSRVEYLEGNCEKFIPGYDYVNIDSDPMDDAGHGTHCASIAGGSNGIAPEATIVPFKVLDAAGSGSTSDIIAAIERAVDPNLDFDTSDHYDIISLSLGGDGDPDDPLSKAVDEAVMEGVTVVVAAGNSGDYRTIASPGCAKEAITVGASCREDQLWGDCYSEIASFSSRGPSYGHVKPDVVAPGVEICAAESSEVDNYGESCGEGYISLSGTSMATPMVAGAVALILQANPSWSPADVKTALRTTARDLGRSPVEQGMGLINVSAAIQADNLSKAYIESLSNVVYK